MAFKTLVPSCTTLDLFIKDPLKLLSFAEEEVLAILKNDIPVMYVVTPNLFKKLFNIINKIKQRNTNPSKIPYRFRTNTLDCINKKNSGKFLMYDQWKPDHDFIRQCSLWGINLTYSVKKEELVSFIDYWKAEKRFFYHIQWQQKLARNLEQMRHYKSFRNSRDINLIAIPDNKIPDGFRDE